MTAKQCQCCGGTGWEGSDCQSLRWIPVEERLPDDDYPVLTLWHGGIRNVECILHDKTWTTAATVTHWMPLPPLPKEEGAK